MSPHAEESAVDVVEVDAEWNLATLATFWLIHPPASGLTGPAPFAHAPVGAASPFGLLQAAAAVDAELSPNGPTFFVVPELSIHADALKELLGLSRDLASNRVIIAGLGHLSQEECERIELGVATDPTLWRIPWAAKRYANAAAVCIAGKSWLEAKDWPSPFEDQAGCHQPHKRLRVFRGRGFSFAVMICSEVLPAWSPDAFMRELVRERVDVVFWIQHNPSPRHEQFRNGLESLYGTQRDLPLIVSVNKRPANGSRSPYGASALYARASCFAHRKDRMQRVNMAIEPVSRGSNVSRAVLLRYDVEAHQILTIHPAAVPVANPPGDFLREVVPYSAEQGVLTPDHRAAHFHELFERGRQRVLDRVTIGVPGHLLSVLKARVSDVEETFTEANALLDFLDKAFLRREASPHDNHESHTLAAQCDCWSHRENFDSLYEQSTAEAVCELILALAVLGICGTAKIDPSLQRVPNVALTLNSRETKLLLTSTELVFDKFLARYFPTRHALTSEPAMIVFGTARGFVLPQLASQTALQSQVNAAIVADPDVSAITGDEFWGAVRLGRIHEVVAELAGERA